jgi:transglutaminase-like putative cysteine protease
MAGDGVRYRICHRTSYAYSTPVFESFNEVRLQPVVDATQALLDFELRIEPPATVITFRDYYGNSVHDFGVAYLHDRLVIEASCDVITHAAADEPLVPAAQSGPDPSPPLDELAADPIVQDEFAEFLGPSPYVALGPESEAIARELVDEHPGSTALDFLERATARIGRLLEYRIGTTTVHSSVAEVLDVGSGVCQDFAHVLISLCRHRGLPARYVSGYLGDVPESGASHAWTEVLVPPYGWLGVDPTHGNHCTGRYVKIGTGRDYSDVSVLRGTYKGGGVAELEVKVSCETVGGPEQLRPSNGANGEPNGRLMAIQNLGAMRRFHQGAVLTQAMGGMSQTLSDELPLPPPRAQKRVADAAPSQQPPQQQQPDRAHA